MNKQQSTNLVDPGNSKVELTEGESLAKLIDLSEQLSQLTCTVMTTFGYCTPKPPRPNALASIAYGASLVEQGASALRDTCEDKDG